jgi:hypothetical protein
MEMVPRRLDDADGWVLTPNEYQYKIRDGLPPNWPKRFLGSLRLGDRLMSPDEIAEAGAYWLSDHSRPFSDSVVGLEQYPFVGRNPIKRGA